MDVTPNAVVMLSGAKHLLFRFFVLRTQNDTGGRLRMTYASVILSEAKYLVFLVLLRKLKYVEISIIYGKL
jgi:hypothetical protein